MPREDFGLRRIPSRTLDHNQRVSQERELTRLLNDTRDGKLNCVGELTLTANASSTTVTDFRVRAASMIILMPRTANAALALCPQPYTFGSVTLDSAPEATGTTVTDSNVQAGSKVILLPTSADAAGEVAGLFDIDEGHLVVYAYAAGQFEIAHAAVSTGTRSFDYIVFNPVARTPAYISNVTKHQFTVAHPTSSATDMTFLYAVLG
jgi:hypothetical protein